MSGGAGAGAGVGAKPLQESATDFLVALGCLERPEIQLGDCFLIGIQENVI